MQIVSGSGQTHARGYTVSGIAKAYFDPMVVKVTSGGVPAANQTVSWSTPPSGMAVQMTPGGGPATSVTGTDGIATLNQMFGKSVEAYYADGDFQVTASTGGASVVFTGHVGGAPGVSQTLSIVSGDHQVQSRQGSEVPGGKARFAPLQVKLQDTTGQALGGRQVQFRAQTAAQMAVQMDPGGSAGWPANTDAGGVATAQEMNHFSVECYYGDGDFTVTASSDGAPAVVFHLSVVAPPTLAIVSGDRQCHAPVSGQCSFGALSVRLTSGSAPLVGQAVTWAIASHGTGMTLQMDPGNAATVTSTTDANGMATLNRMNGQSLTLAGGQGNIQVTATAGAASVTFHLIAGTPLRR